MNVIQTQSKSTSPSTPVSPDKKVRFVVANPELVVQVGQSRVVLPDEFEDLCRNFTRFFPKKRADPTIHCVVQTNKTLRSFKLVNPSKHFRIFPQVTSVNSVNFYKCFIGYKKFC